MTLPLTTSTHPNPNPSTNPSAHSFNRSATGSPRTTERPASHHVNKAWLRARAAHPSNGDRAIINADSHSDGRNAAPNTTDNTPGSSAAASRIVSLDAMRGMALMGIAFVNIPSLWKLELTPGGNDVYRFLGIWVQEHFFPIFAVLFGISFSLIGTAAARRGISAGGARRALAQRLGVLFLLGVVHQFFHPGEALLPYAIGGFLVLLPLSFVPPKARRWATACVAAMLLASGVFLGGGLVAVPGLLAFGFLLGQLNVPAMLDSDARAARMCAALAVVTAAASAWLYQLTDQTNVFFEATSAAKGLTGAAAYVGILLVLWHSPLRNAVAGIFAPMGRMALTNYISATAIMVGAYAVLAPMNVLDETNKTWLFAMGFVALMLIMQSIISAWWMAAHRSGPLEAAWRKLTWAGIDR